MPQDPTSNGALTLLEAGDYRVETFSNDGATLVIVSRGDLEVSGGNVQQRVDSGQAVKLTGTDPIQVSFVALPNPDDFDAWCQNRDRRFEAPLVIGAGGHRCPVARALGEVSPLEEVVVAQESETRLPPEWVERLGVFMRAPELYVEPDLRGYGWYFPKQDFVNIGIGCTGGGDGSLPRAQVGPAMTRVRSRTRTPDMGRSPSRNGSAGLSPILMISISGKDATAMPCGCCAHSSIVRTMKSSGSPG
jgi:flavin-dependent dehydrogenase